MADPSEPVRDRVGAPPPALPAGWIERLGAALVAPTRALAASETRAGSGRAPADLAVLILAAFAATRLSRLVKAGWLAAEGTGMDGVHLLLGDLSATLMTPLLFVFVSGLVIAAMAGPRRSLAADFDLACVAAVPLAALPPLVELIGRLGWSTPGLVAAAGWAGWAWGGGLAVLGVRQARWRTPRGADA